MPKAASRRAVVALVLGAIAPLAPTIARAASVPVANVTQLREAISAAKAGDEIVLEDGTYAMTGITCSAAGTAVAPVVVRAQSPLGARIDFDALEGFKVTGPHWQFEGLEIHGVCASDASCEHAFHVTGNAGGFVLRRSRVVDFNAQLKVNAETVGAGKVAPGDGLVEYSEFFDTSPRDTSSPVTKLNIDNADGWIVRGNVIRDFHRLSGGVTYGAFMKGGNKDGLFERNLVVCERDVTSSTATVGLSFGGGGTGNQFCAPAYAAGTSCLVEHENGVARNNIVANCSDVGIYVNRGKNTRLLFNTLVATTGIDFRFDTTSGEARGNALTSVIRTRDGAQAPSLTDNLTNVTRAAFEAMFRAPLAGDLRTKGDLSPLLGKSAGGTPGVIDDYCARARPATGAFDLGALQVSLGDCATLVPPPPPDAGPGEGGDGGSGGTGGPTTSPTPDGGVRAAPEGSGAGPAGQSGGCAASGRAPSSLAFLGGTFLAVAALRRRRRA